MIYAVFGGNGYLGSQFLNSLKCCEEDKIAVFVRDVNSYDEQEMPDKKIPIYELSVEKMKEFFAENNVDWIINFVGMYENKDAMVSDIVEANSILGMRLLSYCADYKVPNIICINTALPDYFNLYSTTKHRVADLAKFISESYGINYYDICLEMFYGPGEPENRFLHSCIRKMKKNEEIELTNGLQKRDIIHIYDVCEALNCIISANTKGFNSVSVGSGVSVSIREIIEYLKEITNSESQLKFGSIPERRNEASTVADLQYLSSIGFTCRYTWKDGLKTII